MLHDFLNDAIRNKDTARALSQMAGLTDSMSSFVGPRLQEFVKMFCGMLTNGLQWIFLHMRWVDEGRYLIEHTAPICVITKRGENYKINTDSLGVVAESILLVLAVAEEVRQLHQRALHSSHQQASLQVIDEHNDPRDSDTAADDDGGSGLSRRPSRRKRKNKSVKSTSKQMPHANSHGGKNSRSFGDHLTLNALNLRLYSGTSSMQPLSHF
jgi:hypothetical protein